MLLFPNTRIPLYIKQYMYTTNIPFIFNNTSNPLIPRDYGTIDSLCIRLRLENVTILNHKIIDRYTIVYESGEFDDDDTYKRRPIVKNVKGINYRFYIKSFLGAGAVTSDYLVVQMSAKMLKHRYFEGITKANLKYILNDINSFKIFKVSYEDLMDALVSDIDICSNHYVLTEQYLFALGLIYNYPLPGKFNLITPYGLLNKKEDNKGNAGLSFNTREKATPSNPHFKIYHKGNELKKSKKSLDFYKTYINPMNCTILGNILNSVVRSEFTIKNAKHKEHLKKKGLEYPLKTFGQLLDVPAKTLFTISLMGHSYYINGFPKAQREVSSVSPTDLALTHFIRIAQTNNVSYDEGITSLISTIKCRTKKSRLETKLTNLWHSTAAINTGLDYVLNENLIANQFLNTFKFNQTFR